ncbi:hypothetical protein [Thermogutta sp.]|uniref:hypothetical protein n=1 Tax=Thermogutta sp. TaxID=1962930 RepID=UPI0032208857
MILPAILLSSLFILAFAALEAVNRSAGIAGVWVNDVLFNPCIFSSLPPESKLLITITSPFNVYEAPFTGTSPSISIALWFAIYFLSFEMLAILLALFHGSRWPRLFMISSFWALAASYMTSIAHWLYSGIPVFGSSVVEVDLSSAAIAVIVLSLRPLRNAALDDPTERQVEDGPFRGPSLRVIAVLISLAFYSCVLVLAFHDNPSWSNHLVGILFFAGALVQLRHEIRGQPAPVRVGGHEGQRGWIPQSPEGSLPDLPGEREDRPPPRRRRRWTAPAR